MNWKQELKQMKLEYLKRTAEAFFWASGGYDYKVAPYTDRTANALTRSIIDWINFHPTVQGTATRISSTGTMRKIRGQMKWTKGNVRKGIADIHSVIAGVHVSIEVKIGADKMSEAQHKEKERIERAGGRYIVAKDMAGFVDWYNSQFVQGSAVGTVDNCTV